MRTKKELMTFLHRIVGEEYCIIDVGDDSIDIKPYGYQTTIVAVEDTISGYITFKGERLDNFNNSGRDMIKSLVNGMNHSYSTAIKDCLIGDPDMLNNYKMSRFKFQ
tara:strand:- start:1304 stop:1624 length:321 start_codon:yes stop_codon:yes gene_type:complete